MQDEPVLGSEFDTPWSQDSSEPAAAELIRGLVTEEPFAVLCTQGEGRPYGSVIAYAVGPQLCAMTFATPTATRKYRLLCACESVALAIRPKARPPAIGSTATSPGRSR